MTNLEKKMIFSMTEMVCEGPATSISKSKQKRGYTIISEVKRKQLLQILDEENITIKSAAKRLGINYSTAKNIVKTNKRDNIKTLYQKNITKTSTPQEIIGRSIHSLEGLNGNLFNLGPSSNQ